MGQTIGGWVRDQENDLVVVHVEREPGPCRSCGSDDVLTIRVSEDDSPVWVRMCADCDEHVWSLDP